MSKAENSSPLFVGLDDGYAECKIHCSDGLTSRTPSRARPGVIKTVSLNRKKPKNFGYVTNDGEFVAGDIRNPTPTMFDDYPFSAMNRAIVAHSLRMSGIDPSRPLIVCTGLPINRYYRGTKPNKEYITKKRKNLLINDVRATDGTPVPAINNHYIGCEGVLAWVDLVIQRNESGELSFNEDIAEDRIAIVDIGGRTTDVAFIDGGDLDFDRSGTIDEGMLGIKTELKSLIHSETGFEADMSELDRALENGQVKISGEMKDVSELVEQSKEGPMQRIRADVQRLMDKGNADRVLFVGGTTAACTDHIKGWFTNQIIADNPAFANARGACKNAEMMYLR